VEPCVDVMISARQSDMLIRYDSATSRTQPQQSRFLFSFAPRPWRRWRIASSGHTLEANGQARRIKVRVGFSAAWAGRSAGQSRLASPQWCGEHAPVADLEPTFRKSSF
jgi:hypothetical protein